MVDDNLTPDETLPPDGGGDGTASGNQTPSGLKDALGKALGKEFPDDNAALKAVKDTFSHVGDVGILNSLKGAMGELKDSLGLSNDQEVVTYMRDIAKGGGTPGAFDSNKFVSREEFDSSTFFAANPDLKPYARTIGAFRVKPENSGKTIQEIVDSDDDLKGVLSKVRAHDKAEESKSVLQSNPRLGQVRDKVSSSREALKAGDTEQAARDATDAVIDAYGL